MMVKYIRSRHLLTEIILPPGVLIKLLRYLMQHQVHSYPSIFISDVCYHSNHYYSIFIGQIRQTLSGSIQSIMHVSFNNTSEMIAGASNDNAARLWHLKTGRIKVCHVFPYSIFILLFISSSSLSFFLSLFFSSHEIFHYQCFYHFGILFIIEIEKMKSMKFSLH